MRSVLLVIILSILFFHVSPSYAGMPENSESWDVTYHPASSFWTYKKMLSSARTAASHLVHEYKDDEGSLDLTNDHIKERGKNPESSDIEESRIWKKFSFSDDHDRDDFHFKKNKHYYNDDDSDDRDKFSDSDDSDSDFKGGPPPVVPEPASSLLFLSGGSVFIYRRYVKKIKKADIT